MAARIGGRGARLQALTAALWANASGGTRREGSERSLGFGLRLTDSEAGFRRVFGVELAVFKGFWGSGVTNFGALGTGVTVDSK